MQRFFAVYKLLFLTLQLFECHQEDEMLGEFCRARHFYCNGHKKLDDKTLKNEKKGDYEIYTNHLCADIISLRPDKTKGS